MCDHPACKFLDIVEVGNILLEVGVPDGAALFQLGLNGGVDNSPAHLRWGLVKLSVDQAYLPL